jgi:predicted DCC family thiol-disulfide oxidoreductase YuxK
VIYDGICLLCQRSCALLRSLDWLHRLEFIDLRNPESVQGRFPNSDPSRWIEEMHVVFADGRIRSGFDAVRNLLWLLPPALPIAPLLYIPGARRIGGRAYRHVAARRMGSSP